jgi:hypothetical protein
VTRRLFIVRTTLPFALPAVDRKVVLGTERLEAECGGCVGVIAGEEREKPGFVVEGSVTRGGTLACPRA